ncbi:antirestriction protein ArdA [Cronobacter dublinensis]|nr:antirestriction protein ArdA [Cronobacter dublinensis]
MSTTTPAVYVGTYHKYNCGSIYGQWFDLTDFDDEDEFQEACRALHANESDPEFMFQDWEGNRFPCVPGHPAALPVRRHRCAGDRVGPDERLPFPETCPAHRGGLAADRH